MSRDVFVVVIVVVVALFAQFRSWQLNFITVIPMANQSDLANSNAFFLCSTVKYILDTALHLLIVSELGLTLLGKNDILSKILLLPLYRRRLI